MLAFLKATLVGFTTGRESHPALKIYLVFL